MKYSISRSQKTKIEMDSKGKQVTIEWGEYKLSPEVTVDLYLDKVFESIDFTKFTKRGKGSCYHAFGCLDTETSKVWYLPDDIDLENPYTVCPNFTGIPEEDLIRFDFVYYWQIDLNGIIGCGRSIIELAGLLQKFSNRLKERFENVKGEYWTDRLTHEKKPISFKIYGFNLPYDFQFLKNFIEYETEIGENHHEIQVNVYDNVRILDAQMLVGNMSLKGALETVNINIPKDGLEHTKFRDYHTKLNKREVGYALDDVYYLRKFIEEKIRIDDLYNNVYDLPLTKTKEVEFYMDKIRAEKILNPDAEMIKEYKMIKVNEKFNRKNSAYHGKWLILKDGSVRKYSEKSETTLTCAEYENKLMRRRVGKLYENPEECEAEYNMLRAAFAGGFTHANTMHLGELVDNVICYDLCSDYPSEMLVNNFVYAYDEIVDDSCFNYENNTLSNTNKYGYLLHVKFHNFKAKRPFGTMSKCKDFNYAYQCDKKDNEEFLQSLILENVNTDNGRVMYLDTYEIALTDIDLYSLKDFYKWESIEILNIRRGIKYPLLPSVVKTLVKFYTDKCQYKVAESKCIYGTPEYYKVHALLTLSKQKLNSCYGLSVKDKRKFALVKAKTEEEREEVLKNFYKKLSEYNTNLTYAIGVQITAYARKRIFDVIKQIPNKYFIYSDTDSVYVKNNDFCKNVIQNYNVELRKIFMKAVKKYDLPIEKWVKVGKDGNMKEEYPCRYDEDGTCDFFITTGAKRYLKFDVKDDGSWKVKFTVAGLSKIVGEKYAKEKFDTIEKCAAWFSNNFKIPKEIAKKKCHKYVDIKNHLKLKVGNSEIIVGSFVSLRDIAFSGTYTDTVLAFINNLPKIYKEAAKQLGIE